MEFGRYLVGSPSLYGHYPWPRCLCAYPLGPLLSPRPHRRLTRLAPSPVNREQAHSQECGNPGSSAAMAAQRPGHARSQGGGGSDLGGLGMRSLRRGGLGVRHPSADAQRTPEAWPGAASDVRRDRSGHGGTGFAKSASASLHQQGRTSRQAKIDVSPRCRLGKGRRSRRGRERAHSLTWLGSKRPAAI